MLHHIEIILIAQDCTRFFVACIIVRLLRASFYHVSDLLLTSFHILIVAFCLSLLLWHLIWTFSNALLVLFWLKPLVHVSKTIFRKHAITNKSLGWSRDMSNCTTTNHHISSAVFVLEYSTSKFLSENYTVFWKRRRFFTGPVNTELQEAKRKRILESHSVAYVNSEKGLAKKDVIFAAFCDSSGKFKNVSILQQLQQN